MYHVNGERKHFDPDFFGYVNMHFQKFRHQIWIRQIVTCSKMVLKVRFGSGKVPNSTGLEKFWDFLLPSLDFRRNLANLGTLAMSVSTLTLILGRLKYNFNNFDTSSEIVRS